MSSSHNTPAKPSNLLALVCLAVVHRLHPEWTAVSLQEAAAQQEISPQRLSRLCSRAIERFETGLAALTRRGRPRAETDIDPAQQELAITRELLGVATSVLAQVSLRKETIRALVVGAFERLKAEHATLTLERFAGALGISERTFRSWRKRARESDQVKASVEQEQPPPRKPRQRPPRRPRCGFDVTLPDTQFAADTTDLRVFGIDLKLMAVQDVGGRDANLLDGVVIDDHESAERIAEAFTEALAGKEGAQIITDQGTPYMAKALSEVMDELVAEHAPQREGTPTDKPTVEKAFDTIKSIAAPLFELTNRLAQTMPELADPAVAMSSARLLIVMLLRAYQAGARATRRAIEARGNVAPEELAKLAEQSRERARKRDHSVRLRLRHIHELYNFPSPVDAFVRSFRGYPLQVLDAAERRFRDQAHRDDIRDRTSYFFAIVRKCDEHHRQERARKYLNDAAARERKRQKAVCEAEIRRHQANPAQWLHAVLAYIATPWDAARGSFGLGNGQLGLGKLRAAINRLVELHGANAARDIAQGLMLNFAALNREHLAGGGEAAVSEILERHLPKRQTNENTAKFASAFAAATLHKTGSEPHPGTSDPLRTLPAGSVGS